MKELLKMIQISQNLNNDLLDLYFKAEALIKLSIEQTENIKFKLFLQQELKDLEVKLYDSMNEIKKVNDEYKNNPNLN